MPAYKPNNSFFGWVWVTDENYKGGGEEYIEGGNDEQLLTGLSVVDVMWWTVCGPVSPAGALGAVGPRCMATAGDPRNDEKNSPKPS